MALMEIIVVPVGTSSSSIGDFIAGVENELLKEDVDHRLTDMGTIIEGDIEELLPLAVKLHKVPFQRGVRRVLTTITIDDRRDKQVKLNDKIESVQARLNK